MSSLRATRRRRNFRRRVAFYGTVVALMVGFYYYQPNRIDFIPRQPPTNNSPVDPDSNHLFAKGTKVAIVTAHPDDAEFFLGGTLTRLGAAGAEVTLIVCTSGDKSYYPWENGRDLAKVREGEQLKAFGRWHGSWLYFLHFPDGRLRANGELKRRVLGLLQKAQPEYILAFDGEYPPRISHGDHRAAGEAVEAIAGQTSAKWLMRFQTSAPNYAVDISDQWEEKKKLLAIHASQFAHKLEGITNMVEDMAIRDGEFANTTYAEGLRCTKLRD